MKTLAYTVDSNTKYACWKDLTDLYDHESNQLFKMSSLTKAAVYPRPVEKQKVSLVLNVFSDKTAAGLESSSIATPSSSDTAEFCGEAVETFQLQK